jgi:L-aminopeptidase/D-esterase-like protein
MRARGFRSATAALLLAVAFLQVRELGVLETPIVPTNTLAVGTAIEAVVRWGWARPVTKAWAPSTPSSARPTTAT